MVDDAAPSNALESANPPAIQDETCEQIKARFGIKTDTHDNNEDEKSVDNQSHHVAQDAATDSHIPRGEAIAVLLSNSHRNTEHGVITKRQNARMNNKKNILAGKTPKSKSRYSLTAVPAKNWGELKALSKEDLVEGLTGRRKDKNNGKPMTKDEAEKIADCLAAEAEEAIKKNKAPKPVNDDMPVDPPGECFSADTLIWLTDTNHIPAANIRLGDLVETDFGLEEVIRTDQCASDLVVLDFGEWSISAAPFHRIHLANGGVRRADELRPGWFLECAIGPVEVLSVLRDACMQPVYSFGFRFSSACRIGKYGLWVEIPYRGLPVSRCETIRSYRPDEVSIGSPRHEDSI
jgi:hypothetical protein